MLKSEYVSNCNNFLPSSIRFLECSFILTMKLVGRGKIQQGWGDQKAVLIISITKQKGETKRSHQGGGRREAFQAHFVL